jgi:hypothetical protein
MYRIGLNDCPHCGSSEVYRSHLKTLLDHVGLFLLLGPVRCHGCMRRHYRPLFLPASEFIDLPAKKPVRAYPDDKRKRSA